MTETRVQNEDQLDLSAQAVEDYLTNHPDFFNQRSSLLSVLSIPHATRGTVSLIERQVELLRERNRQLESKLVDLVQVARENEELGSRLQRMALAMIEAEDINDVLNSAIELLRNEFPSTMVAVRVLTPDGEIGAVPSNHHMDQEVAEGLFSSLFNSRRPVCGEPDTRQKEYLFCGDTIRSAVLIPLSDGRKLGILALGSPEANRFQSGMGTLFLGALGELVSRSLKSHMLS